MKSVATPAPSSEARATHSRSRIARALGRREPAWTTPDELASRRALRTNRGSELTPSSAGGDGNGGAAARDDGPCAATSPSGASPDLRTCTRSNGSAALAALPPKFERRSCSDGENLLALEPAKPLTSPGSDADTSAPLRSSASMALEAAVPPTPDAVALPPPMTCSGDRIASSDPPRWRRAPSALSPVRPSPVASTPATTTPPSTAQSCARCTSGSSGSKRLSSSTDHDAPTNARCARPLPGRRKPSDDRDCVIKPPRLSPDPCRRRRGSGSDSARARRCSSTNAQKSLSHKPRPSLHSTSRTPRSSALFSTTAGTSPDAGMHASRASRIRHS
mmetsp:Transcript_27918/g.90089  ORF Transcript_27918/g.90089 Transcript_27918/m.90089 type:complete len:334 (+) Transcript_27918:1261-2262(+)